MYDRKIGNNAIREKLHQSGEDLMQNSFEIERNKKKQQKNKTIVVCYCGRKNAQNQN